MELGPLVCRRHVGLVHREFVLLKDGGHGSIAVDGHRDGVGRGRGAWRKWSDPVLEFPTGFGKPRERDTCWRAKT
jgi:hypothetical protein